MRRATTRLTDIVLQVRDRSNAAEKTAEIGSAELEASLRKVQSSTAQLARQDLPAASESNNPLPQIHAEFIMSCSSGRS